MGDVVMRSDLIISEYADKKLYFQHRQITRDRKFWEPEWRALEEDKFFDKNDPENVFGMETPAWPEDSDEAE